MTRKSPKPDPLICKIDVTGFAGVMLVIVYILIFPPIPGGEAPGWGRSVDFAKVYHAVRMPHANREDAMVITITRDGKVFLGGDEEMIEHLPEQIRGHSARGAERKVYLKVDRNARYSDVLEVLDQVSAADVEKVAFLVENKPRG